MRELFEDDRGYSPDLWQKMADLGWLGMMLPMAYGGSERSLVDVVLLQEEMGRALMPSPFVPTAVAACGLLLGAGSEEQKEHLLPRVATGKTILTAAFPGLQAGVSPDSVQVEATETEEGFVINGKARFVPYGHVANYLVCLALTPVSETTEEQMRLLLVDAQAEGVQMDPLETVTGEKLSNITFRDVQIPSSNTVGESRQIGPLLEKVLTAAAIAECGWMIGGAQWVLDTAIAYSEERIQFGVPTGSFQAIQHKCADMKTDIDAATLVTHHAAWAASEDDPDLSLIASEAKSWCSDMYPRITAEGIQILGGIGFTLEHDMQLHYRQAQASRFAYGDAHYHRERLAGMLDL